MKIRPRLLIAALPFLLQMNSQATAQNVYQLQITNPSAVNRGDELVILKRTFLEDKLGKIPAGSFLTLSAGSNNPVSLQFDDTDKDGNWDEAAFLYSFKPNQQAAFTVKISSNIPATSTARAHVRHMRKNADDTFGPALKADSVPAGQPNTDFSKQKLPPFLTEGPAWENDKVGFRIYFDVRNTKDIWGKLTPRMMLDTIGTNPSDSYHHLSYWGMDLLAVGNALGAGSLALLIPQTGKDTLVRLGGNNMGPVIYEMISDGPVRALFRMHYPGWKAFDGQAPVSLTEEISIWGGQYFYESKVTLHNAPAGSQLVSGIVNLKSKTSTEVNAGEARGLFTYDNQSENNDKLGMALLTPGNLFAASGKTPDAGTDITHTWYVAMKATAGQPASFRYYAAWEKSDPRFSTEEGFRKYITEESVRFGTPLKLVWKTAR